MKNTLHLLKTFLLIISCSFFFFQTNAQVEKCAFDRILEEKKQDPHFSQIRAQVESYIEQFANSAQTRTSGTVNIPCIIHVIHTGQAVGTATTTGANPNDAQLISAITDMNDAFKHTGVYAGKPGYTASTDVSFSLAKTAPDGSGTTGIKRYDVSGESWGTNYANNGMNADNGMSPGVLQATITSGRFWPPMDYMNIWIVHEVENATSTLGFASFPQANVGGTDGLTMLASAFGYDPTNGLGYLLNPSTNLNGTANHEIGHYLNLYHTFTGDNNGAVCPADMTCGTDSDCCPDVPAHKRTSGCPADNSTGNECGGGPNSYIHNFMDYADDACFHGFSTNQKTRMEAALASPRVALCHSIADDPPAGSYPSTVTPPSVTNLDQTMGVYDVTLNGTTFKSWSSYHDGGYANRVASAPRINLVKSTSYTMTVQVGVGNAANNELVNVYIDYNNNGSFGDSGEEIYVTPGGSGKKNGDVFSFSFTTPAVPLSLGRRMRIISDFDAGSSLTSNHTPSQGGQIEDFTIQLMNSLPVELVSFKATPGQNTIKLDWQTASELNNKGFEIQRRSESDEIFRNIGWVAGKGSISQKMNYLFEDNNLEKGVIYYYRLKQLDYDGQFTYSNIEYAKLSMTAHAHVNIFPNPARGRVTLAVTGFEEVESKVRLFSSTGQLVQEINYDFQNQSTLEINLTNLSSGIYFIQVIGKKESLTQRLTIHN